MLARDHPAGQVTSNLRQSGATSSRPVRGHSAQAVRPIGPPRSNPDRPPPHSPSDVDRLLVRAGRTLVLPAEEEASHAIALGAQATAG
jgi:hypothetical protein